MRTHYCGELTEALVDHEIALCGWVHHRRDHGGVIFIDLRDREGVAQVVVDPGTPAAFALAARVRGEYVLRVRGRLRRRPEGTINPDMPTGAVELLAFELDILNDARTPPFQVEERHVHEDTRLKYRYIDSHDTPQANLRLRPGRASCAASSTTRGFSKSRRRC